MLHTIRARATPDALDALDALLACHARIRSFTATALRLPTASDRPGDDVAVAASVVLRYFTVALPLHSADEDLSLRHQLLASGASSELRDALATTAAQHVEIEQTIAALAPSWRALVAAPARLGQLAGGLAEHTARLEASWRVHLAIEEQTILPAARRALAADALRQIADEMRARRPPEAFAPWHDPRRGA